MEIRSRTTFTPEEKQKICEEIASSGLSATAWAKQNGHKSRTIRNIYATYRDKNEIRQEPLPTSSDTAMPHPSNETPITVTGSVQTYPVESNEDDRDSFIFSHHKEPEPSKPNYEQVRPPSSLAVKLPRPIALPYTNGGIDMASLVYAESCLNLRRNL